MFRENDFFTFVKVLNFVPKECIMREHQNLLSPTVPPALLIGSAAGRLDMCDLLLEKCGSEILLEAKNHLGATALHVAARSNNEPLIRLFLAKYDGAALLSTLCSVSPFVYAFLLKEHSLRA